MNDIQCLSHTKWECKFHIVWIPKCRRKMLYGQLRKNLGDVLHDLALQKESRVLEGHLQPDHVHMLISIPPKYAVSQVVGCVFRTKTATVPIGKRPDDDGLPCEQPGQQCPP